MSPRVTVLIPSKNRPDCVQRLVKSIRQQDFSEPIEIIVVDDGSAPPLSIADPDVRLLRNPQSTGACAARNRGFAAATGEFILMFDDDTELHDPSLVKRAVTLARSQPKFGAIGFRHLNTDGNPDPYQPADSPVACQAACFFGYGVMLRTEAIRQIEGFVDNFGYGYEEQDLCLQLHDAGWLVMFAPSLTLLHHHDPRGRNWKRIHRLITRNAIWSTMIRFPLVAIVPCIAWRWTMFVWSSRSLIGSTDWSGALWLITSTLGYLPYAVRNRSAISFKTMIRFRKLRNEPEPIESADLDLLDEDVEELETQCTISASS
jgi:glycosyltransferase involved in cell wall biosynthesis